LVTRERKKTILGKTAVVNQRKREKPKSALVPRGKGGK